MSAWFLLIPGAVAVIVASELVAASAFSSADREGLEPTNHIAQLQREDSDKGFFQRLASALRPKKGV